MRVKIKKLHPDAVMPFKTYDNDFCYDVVAVSEEEIAPNVWKYGLGFALQIDRKPNNKQNATMIEWNKLRGGNDYPQIPLSIDLRSRSSIYKTGMILSNSVGTVDEGYTNEISAIFYHIMPNMPRYKVGDKIAQCKIGVTFPIEFVYVADLDNTARGTSGYGSTGR